MDLNSTAQRPDIGGEVYPDGEMPQMGGAFSSLLPGTNVFRLPVNLPALWVEVKYKDPRSQVEVDGVQLKLDKNAPLVVVGGDQDGETLTATFSTMPIPRGKKDDPATPYISDLALMLDVGLEGNLAVGQRTRPLAKVGPAAIAALKAAINRFAGRTVRIEHGLSATCRADKVRYILEKVQDAAGNWVDNPEGKTHLDPSGLTGCAVPGTKAGRYYTKDFKRPTKVAGPTGQMIDNPDPGYDDQILCTCGDATGVSVVLRGFPRVERFLPPVPGPTGVVPQK